MIIRPATLLDLAAILDIYNQAVLTTTATYDYDPRPMAIQETWFHDHEREGYPIFVATDPHGSVMGWGSLSSFHPRIGYQFTVENSLYVAESHQRQGVGRRLLARLINAAEELGFHAILAGIDADNQASLLLHAKFGFETVGHLKQVGYKFDRWLDLVYKQRIVDAGSGSFADKSNNP